MCVAVVKDIVQILIMTQTIISQVTKMVIIATTTTIIQAGVMEGYMMTMTSMPERCAASAEVGIGENGGDVL